MKILATYYQLLSKDVLHMYVYMYAIVVPNLIWKHLFSQLLAYVVTMATHIPLL